MNQQANFEIVCESPLGVELNKEDCKVLAGVIETQTLKDGDILIKEGGTDDSLHVVISGRLAVTRDVGGGDYVTLHVLNPGDFAGAMGFVDGGERSATLRALCDTDVYTLHRETFESLVTTHPALVYQVMRSIIRSVHRTVLRMNQQFVELQNYVTKEHGRY